MTDRKMLLASCSLVDSQDLMFPRNYLFSDTCSNSSKASICRSSACWRWKGRSIICNVLIREQLDSTGHHGQTDSLMSWGRNLQSAHAKSQLQYFHLTSSALGSKTADQAFKPPAGWFHHYPASSKSVRNENMMSSAVSHQGTILCQAAGSTPPRCHMCYLPH